MSTEVTTSAAISETNSVPVEPSIAVIVDSKAENNLYTYIFIGVLVVVLVLMLYYAYGRFTSNSKGRGKKTEDDEADDPVLDFNLRESIKELQRIQNRVVSTLSEQSDI